MLDGSEISDLFGKRTELDEQSIRDRILEIESRVTWLSSELRDPANGSYETCRYSKEILESFEDEKNLLNLTINMLYRRKEAIEKEK